MKFSYEKITDNYLFLKKIVNELHENYFLYMSKHEIRAEKNNIIEELRSATSFNLLTKFEADIRIDYNDAIKMGKKDDLSVKYMKICQELREKYKEYDKPLEKICQRMPFEDILEEIKTYLKESALILHQNLSIIKGYLRFRHYYAHGKYFKHKPQTPDPEDVGIVCKEIVNEVINRS